MFTLWALLRTLLTTCDRLVCMACKALSSRGDLVPLRGVARVRSPLAQPAIRAPCCPAGWDHRAAESHGACNAQGTDHCQHHHRLMVVARCAVVAALAATSLLVLAIKLARLIDQLRRLTVDALHHLVPWCPGRGRRLETSKPLRYARPMPFVAWTNFVTWSRSSPQAAASAVLRFGPDGGSCFSNGPAG